MYRYPKRYLTVNHINVFGILGQWHFGEYWAGKERFAVKTNPSNTRQYRYSHTAAYQDMMIREEDWDEDASLPKPACSISVFFWGPGGGKFVRKKKLREL